MIYYLLIAIGQHSMYSIVVFLSKLYLIGQTVPRNDYKELIKKDYVALTTNRQGSNYRVRNNANFCISHLQIKDRVLMVNISNCKYLNGKNLEIYRQQVKKLAEIPYLQKNAKQTHDEDFQKQ